MTRGPAEPRPPGRGGRRGQGQLVPARGALRSPPDQAPAGAERGYAYQRRDAGDQHNRVADHGPGQQDEDQERHEPPRCLPAVGRDAVDQQPGDQHRNGGAGVVRRQEQDLGGAELGRQHDARGQQRPRPAGPAGGPALGQPRSQQDEQRVGQGRADVDHPGAQSQHGLEQRVLRQLGGVERHIRDPPIVQQQVPVQHGVRLEHDARSVGRYRHRFGLAPVQGEQPGGGQRDHGGPPGRAGPRAPGPRRAHRGLGRHKGQAYGPAGPAATGAPRPGRRGRRPAVVTAPAVRWSRS